MGFTDVSTSCKHPFPHRTRCGVRSTTIPGGLLQRKASSLCARKSSRGAPRAPDERPGPGDGFGAWFLGGSTREVRNTKGAPGTDHFIDQLIFWFAGEIWLSKGVHLTLPESLEDMSTAIDSSWSLDNLITHIPQMIRNPPLRSHHWRCWACCDWWTYSYHLQTSLKLRL